MIQITYPINDHEKIQLAGPAESNLIKIEQAYGLKVMTRSQGLILQSSTESQIQEATKTLDNMRRVIKSGNILSDIMLQEMLPGGSKMNNPGESPVFECFLQPPILYDRWGKPVQPRTPGQAAFIDTVHKHDITLTIGPAGTGKTFLAVALAVAYLQQKKVTKIILVRPAVESGEYLGFLPGDLREKIAPYMTPLFDSLNAVMFPDTLAELRSSQEIEIAPLAYMRGRTLNNSFILLDEAQNTTISQMKMFLTRMGVNSKAVVTGDETQKDLPENKTSGLSHARKILKGIKGIHNVSLTEKDVVRHRTVRDIILAYERQRSRHK